MVKSPNSGPTGWSQIRWHLILGVVHAAISGFWLFLVVGFALMSPFLAKSDASASLSRIATDPLLILLGLLFMVFTYQVIQGIRHKVDLFYIMVSLETEYDLAIPNATQDQRAAYYALETRLRKRRLIEAVKKSTIYAWLASFSGMLFYFKNRTHDYSSSDEFVGGAYWWSVGAFAICVIALLVFLDVARVASKRLR